MEPKSKYVLPHLRKAEELSRPPDVENIKEFPSLGSIKKPGGGAWGNKNSFKDTIVNLIEYEKLSEQEKKVREQQEKELDGWYEVPRFTRESQERMFNIIELQIKEEEKRFQEGGFYFPSVPEIVEEETLKKKIVVKPVVYVDEEYYEEEEDCNNSDDANVEEPEH